MGGISSMNLGTDFKKSIMSNIRTQFGKTFDTASQYEKYYALSKSVINLIGDNWSKTEKKYDEDRRAAYLSAEYLMGRVFSNNLINLGIYDEVESIISELDLNINELEQLESDAG